MYGEVCSSQKMFTNGLNRCLPWGAEVEKKTSIEWKCTDSLVKKKFQVHQSVKEAMLTVFCNMKGSIAISFLEKSATVNTASNCFFLKQNSPYLLNDPCICANIHIYIYILSSLGHTVSMDFPDSLSPFIPIVVALLGTRNNYDTRKELS